MSGCALYVGYFFFLMIRRPPRSTLFPYTNALPISAKHFASGWVTLAHDPHSGALEIVDLKDHETVIPRGMNHLMILDVWEHAYYVKYQNRRPEFIEAFWKVVNWEYAEQR